MRIQKMMKALFAAFMVLATIACEKEPTNKPNEQEKEPTLSVEISEV